MKLLEAWKLFGVFVVNLLDLNQTGEFFSLKEVSMISAIIL